MSTASELLLPVRELHRSIRDEVVRSCERQSVEQLCTVAQDGQGDTLYAIDRVGEALLVEQLERAAVAHGGIVLVAEGLEGGQLCLPRGQAASELRWCIIVDPIDGTESGGRDQAERRAGQRADRDPDAQAASV
jgi:fructose-1,6-bisphosphatase/inositol monophosphatase family enzyme